MVIESPGKALKRQYQEQLQQYSSDLSENEDLDEKSGYHSYGSDRKKRRGIIEKRRRDRINNSLTDLKRLVPAAYEKQGSAKLEKAEILQMTVDHLNAIQQKGGYGYADSAGIAMEYRSIGFRECLAEVARYLVTVEGLDVHDPLRVRLISHLQYVGHQRDAEASAKASHTPPLACFQPSASQPVPPTYPGTSNQHHSPWNCQQSQTSVSTYTGSAFQHSSSNHPHPPRLTLGVQAATDVKSEFSAQQQPSHVQPPQSSYTAMLASTDSSQASTSSTTPTGLTSPVNAKPSISSPTYLPSSGSFLYPSTSTTETAFNPFTAYPGASTVGNTSAGSYYGYGPMPASAGHSGLFGASSAQMHNVMKPYRPWGTELGAY